MGYSYGYNPRNGRYDLLSCDNCGMTSADGMPNSPIVVRRRTCPHKVTCDSSRGPRHTMPYCPPPALCGACLKAKGGTKAIHAGCAEGAASSQAEYDRIQALVDAGEFLVTSACGSWHDDCPEGMALVTFRNGAGAERTVLVSAVEYDPALRKCLSDYVVLGEVAA